MIYPELIKKIFPTTLIGFFAAIVMGAVLSTFNSVLNSTATIFSIDIYKRHINKKVSDFKMVKIGKLTSAILAIFSILVAPMVANAPDGLYQLLQQLNGIFFIPIASIMLAGFFTSYISTKAANISLFFGLFFYVITTFVLEVNLHFIHIWGIEFLLNMLIMFIFSYFFKNVEPKINIKITKQTKWKYSNQLSYMLIFFTLLIYVILGI